MVAGEPGTAGAWADADEGRVVGDWGARWRSAQRESASDV